MQQRQQQVEPISLLTEEEEKAEEEEKKKALLPAPGGKKQTKAPPIKTAAPVWTTRLRNALTASVEKHKGKASNGGIAWVSVVADMHMSKHYCTKEWKKIEEEHVHVQSSSSEEEEEAPRGGGGGGGAEAEREAVMKRFLLAEMKTMDLKMSKALQKKDEEIKTLLDANWARREDRKRAEEEEVVVV
jgi:hypothetical protein